jgi:hypothetical protein
MVWILKRNFWFCVVVPSCDDTKLFSKLKEIYKVLVYVLCDANILY